MKILIILTALSAFEMLLLKVLLFKKLIPVEQDVFPQKAIPKKKRLHYRL